MCGPSGERGGVCGVSLSGSEEKTDLTGPISPQMVVCVGNGPATTASFGLVKCYDAPREFRLWGLNENPKEARPKLGGSLNI